jgi:hypothetical protein
VVDSQPSMGNTSHAYQQLHTIGPSGSMRPHAHDIDKGIPPKGKHAEMVPGIPEPLGCSNPARQRTLAVWTEFCNPRIHRLDHPERARDGYLHLSR